MSRKGNDMIDIIGTGLKGHVETTYAKLVETFGEPNSPTDGCKIQARWAITTPNGDVITIYDWMENAYWRGIGNGIPVEDVTFWHIGGRVPAVVSWVKQQLAGEAR